MLAACAFALAMALVAGGQPAYADVTAGSSELLGAQTTETTAAKTTPATSTVTMYRLYNASSGEHLYTASAKERSGLIKIGWRDEGVGWYAPSKSNTPVYRMYNPNSGDHHYCLTTQERDTLSGIGWRYEGVGWFSDDSKRAPLYRQFNPNATVGTHNYTYSKTENDSLVSVGWRAEGVGWYAVRVPRTNPSYIDATNNKRVTLTGVMVRKNEPMSVTHMAWGSATYLLQLPEPVTIKYNVGGTKTSKTKTLTMVHVVSKEFYSATGTSQDIYYANHPEAASTIYDGYVSKSVTVTGGIFNTLNAHTRADCKFTSPTIRVN